MSLFTEDRLIVSLCDHSGRWSDPYRAAGYEVMKIDLKNGDDARLLKKLDRPVHGILAAPVCTAFSGAGARHWAAKADTGNQQLLDGLALSDACLRIITVHKPVWWVLENPVGRLKDWIGPAVMTFQPHHFAGWNADPLEDAYTKRTCLWGEFTKPERRNVEPVDQSNDGSGNTSKMHAKYGGKSDRTKELRSMTPRGFAAAFFAANP